MLPARLNCEIRGFAGTTVSGHFEGRIRRCRGVGHGRDLCLCILLFLPDPHAMMSLGPDLCACILHGPDVSVLFRGPNPRRGILRHPHRSSLRGRGLCPCFFLRRPSLELLEQGFSERLASLGLALTDLGLFLTPTLVSDRSRPGSDRQVHPPRQFRCAPARPLSPAARPACRQLFEWVTSMERLAEAPVCRPTNPSRSQRA